MYRYCDCSSVSCCKKIELSEQENRRLVARGLLTISKECQSLKMSRNLYHFIGEKDYYYLATNSRAYNE